MDLRRALPITSPSAGVERFWPGAAIRPSELRRSAKDAGQPRPALPPVPARELDEELDSAYAALRDLHARAFGWEPPHVPGLERLQATRMRQHVRAWINEWDLVRLDPVGSSARCSQVCRKGQRPCPQEEATVRHDPREA